MRRCNFSMLIAAVLPLFAQTLSAAEPTSVPANFSRDQLVAWCIVPFDASKRGPEARAKMVEGLGLKRVAYDWRAEHVSEFEEEIRQYQKHGLEFFAFWSWHDSLAPLIEKYDIRPQIWITNPSPAADTQEDKVKLAAEQLLPLVQKAAAINCQLGLYNHGGWGGEPENLVAVCKFLIEKHNATNVGIVYNFHHGHGHISDFAQSLERMKPHLLCLNLNGMLDEASVTNIETKIVALGSGKHEAEMIQTVIKSGYTGPIGILDHRPDLDAEEILRRNIDGLEKLLSSLPQ